MVFKLGFSFEIKTLLSIIAFLLIYPSYLSAYSEPFILNNANSTLIANKHTEFFEDQSRELKLEQVTQPNQTKHFIANTEPNLNFGRSRSAFWIRFQITNQSEKKWYLFLDSMLGDKLDLYVTPTNEIITDQATAKIITEQYAQTIKNHRRHAWSLDLPKGEIFKIYIRVTNGDSVINVPIKLITADTMLNESNWHYKLNAAIYSGMVVLALYQLFMFFILREKNYFFLAINMIAIMMTIHRTNPVFDTLDFLGNTSSYFFTAPILLSIISNSAYSRIMLSTKENARWIDSGFNLLTWTSLVLILITGAISGGTTLPLLLGLITLLYTQFSSFYIAYYKKGGRIAKYFAWIYIFPFIMQIPTLVMLVFHHTSWQAQQEIITAISTLLFMLFLALLQAHRVRLLREDMQRTTVSNQAKDDFIAVMSHELRTPMNAIVGLGNLLNLEKSPDTRKIYLNRLNRATQHMMQLINNILDFSKTKQPNFALENKPFQLDIAIRSIHQQFIQQAEQKGLQLKLNDQFDKSLQVVGNRPGLSQVLNNLLTNSIRYTAEGEVRIDITQLEPSSNDKTAKLRFSIQDTGLGIPNDQINKLFEPYKQVKNPSVSAHHEGLGLGLFISKKLVHQMGGHLNVNSQQGVGSEFYFELEMPIVSKSERVDTNNSEFAELKLPLGSRVLLVDDSELNRFVGTEMLRNMGAHVEQAINGKNAILQMQQYTYDLVILDISMPEMDGFEVIHWIRQHNKNPNIPVIALTAHTLEGMKEQCKAAGMNDFITKPFEYQTFHQIINQFLMK